MRKRRGKATPSAAPRSRQRLSASRQRQRLIDACISALHLYGPSQTTVEKVVAIAKLSPGIVRFYFKSKGAMLVASLRFLSTEFEAQVLEPVRRLRDSQFRRRFPLDVPLLLGIILNCLRGRSAGSRTRMQHGATHRNNILRRRPRGAT